MPVQTGIKNREQYLTRLLQEDEKIAGKDKIYGEYLTSLRELMVLTNQIYEDDKGKLNKDTYERLVNSYLNVAEKSTAYKTNGTSECGIKHSKRSGRVVERIREGNEAGSRREGPREPELN